MEAAKDGQADQWFTLGAVLLGAVVGSVVSGGVTFAMQMRSQRDASKARSVALILKLSKIASSLVGANQQVLEGIAEAEAGGALGGAWEKMVAMGGMSKIYIHPEEFSVFIDMKDYDYLNKLLLIDDKHNAVVDAIAMYSEKRTSLLDLMPARMEGLAGHVEIDDPVLFAKVSPKIAEVKLMAENLLILLKDYSEDASALVSESGQKLRDHFKDKSFPLLKPIEKPLPGEAPA